MNQNVKLDNQKECASVITHGLSHDGRGIATIGGKTTFVRGALPNETITYTITRKRSTYNEADINTILSPSPERATPPCRHFGVCGGCNLQHMDMPTQLALKEHTLLEQLKHFGRTHPQVILPPLSADTVGYRHKARLGVKFVIKKDKVLVGFREKASRYLADLSHCAVLHPSIGEHLPELSQCIASLSIYQSIPQIEVAIGDRDVALVFRHMAPLTEADQIKLIEFGKTHQFHLYLQPNPPLPVSQLWPEDKPERIRYTLPDEQLEFLFHPLDFTQINLAMNRLMVKQAIHLLNLQPDDRVLDLFCGIGNFTLPIAKYVQQVTGVEGSDEMVKRAQQNALHNHLHHVNFYAANLQTPSQHAPWLQSNFNKALLDPPRAGAREILSQINQRMIKRMVYVSCNPATLARDAGELVHTYGYTLTHAGIMNMFPHTAHIEAMAVFEK